LFCLLADQWLIQPIKEEVVDFRAGEEDVEIGVKASEGSAVVVVEATGEAVVIEEKEAAAVAQTRTLRARGSLLPSSVV